jgi:hypothetical protein
MVWSAVLSFQLNGVRFDVVAASPTDEAGGETLVSSDYRFGESVEGKILTELIDLAWGEYDKARDEASEILVQQLANLAAEACLPTMQRLAPTPGPGPDPQTLHDYLYPQTHMLQVLTDFGRGKLTCCTVDGYAGIPDPHPPVSEDALRTMGLDLETTDVPIIKPSQVIFIRRLQSLVWRVTVDGEEMICKASIDVFENAIGEELAAYLKIRSAGVKLDVPELKGECRRPVHGLPAPISLCSASSNRFNRHYTVPQRSHRHPPGLHSPQVPQPSCSFGQCRGRRCHTKRSDCMPQAQVGNPNPGNFKELA